MMLSAYQREQFAALAEDVRRGLLRKVPEGEATRYVDGATAAIDAFVAILGPQKVARVDIIRGEDTSLD